MSVSTSPRPGTLATGPRLTVFVQGSCISAMVAVTSSTIGSMDMMWAPAMSTWHSPES